MEKRVRVCFSGTVQGVGFRYTAERIARRRRVAGFVRNLADGNVELVAEGEEEELQSFIEDIQSSGLRDYIRETRFEWGDSRREFRIFEIRF
jgi:acylphosphatase